MKVKRVLGIVLAATLMSGPAIGVSAQKAGTGDRVITDAYGRQVVIPKVVKTAAAIGGAARIMTYAGCANALVGVTDMDKKNVTAMPYSAVNASRFASLPSVGSGGANDTPYIEKLVELAPDVIIAHTDASTVKTVAEKTGIPTIGIYPVDMFDQSFYQALTIIGDVMGTKDRCAKVISYIKGCKDDLEARTKDIPEKGKPTVYTGAVSFRGGHGFEGTYANYPPFDAIHAKNVADQTGQKGAFLVDIEKVLTWDPDIIFLNPTNMSLVNEQYGKNKAFYDGLGAVKRGKVYSQISYNYNWTNMEIAIADTYYAGKIIFPDRFSDIDPMKKADEIFTVMLGTPFYSRLAADGMTFSAMRIGN
jgi:ABC-type Fe3+-hydroxamate transport system, periplasmic component